MPRGRRRTYAAVAQPSDITALEAQLNELRSRQLELKQQIRRMRNSQGEISKLEEKLESQLAAAKWTVGQIKEVRPEWDEWGFYQSVQAKQPAPRGRRKKVVTEEA